MAPVVSLPSGNVAVVTADQDYLQWALPMQRAQDPDEGSIGWSIRHSDGEVVRAHIPTRAEASRLLGSLAAHGASLPLVVYDPDGQSIGERLG